MELCSAAQQTRVRVSEPQVFLTIRHEASAIVPRGNANVYNVCCCSPQMKLLLKVSRSLPESDGSLQVAGVSISVGFLNNKNKECAKLE